MLKELYQSAVHQPPAIYNGSVSHKAMILSSSKWNQLLATATQPEDAPQTANASSMAEKEAEFKQYLKQESQAMTKKWENTVQNIREKKEQERLKKQLERVEEDEKHYRELKAADEVKRKELIQKVEEMIQKEREGPRVLESTAKFCEVLKTRDYQREFRSKQESVQNLRRKELEQQENAQANRWIKSQAERQTEDRKRFDCYKKELKQKIEHDRNEHRQKRNFLIDLERKQHQVLQEEIKRQIDKEQKMLERNKELRRQQALETIRMAHEREERIKREAQIEDSLNQIYNEGQKAIADKRKEIHLNKHKFRDNTRLLKESVEREKQLREAERLAREKVTKEKEAEAVAKDREKMQLECAARASRIQAHHVQMKWRSQREEEQAEIDRKEIADRLKNVDVTFGFDHRKVNDKIVQTHVQRELLLEQMDEKIVREKKEADTHAELQFMRDCAEKENQHFLRYADELVSDARTKGRPILPLLKTVRNYKREHYFDFKEIDFVPRHLVSRVPINNKLTERCESLEANPAITDVSSIMPPIEVRCDPNQRQNIDPYRDLKQ